MLKLAQELGATVANPSAPEAAPALVRYAREHNLARLVIGRTQRRWPWQRSAADRIAVTPDSVNMLSEACATGKPVFTLLPESARGKLTGLHAELRAQGWLHALDANVDFSTLQQPPPLRELAAVASKVWHVLESTRPDVVAALTAD